MTTKIEIIIYLSFIFIKTTRNHFSIYPTLNNSSDVLVISLTLPISVELFILHFSLNKSILPLVFITPEKV